MNIMIYIFCFSILLSQNGLDSLKNLGKFNLGKINLPGIIPETVPIVNEFVLLEYQIEEIKNRAKNFNYKPVSKDDIVIMETNRGTMKLRLFPDVAPNHCNNFKKLANSGFYDKTSFHRIVQNFIIQGGDIYSRDNDPSNDGHGGPGWTIDAEFNSIPHKRGILSMARSSDLNSAGSQFFICVSDAPHLDSNYTVFGEVIEKVHIIDHIVNTPTENMQVQRLSKKFIPKDEDPQNWITLRDPKTKKQLYLKVPKYRKKSDYEYEMKKKINSDRPSLPLIIEKIRVIENAIK